MFSTLFLDPLVFIVSIVGLILSLTIHEFAHAFMADRLGDPTPRMQGRLTLNPLAHLDPLGTVALILTRFGWGKPVQFDPFNLKNPIRDSALIALAGPASNLLIAVVLAQINNFHLLPAESWQLFVVGQVLIINLVLAVFNLVPVYPLDGSKIIIPLLPRSTAIEYDHFMRKYGMFIMLALILPWANGISPVNALILPIIERILRLLITA